MYVLATLLTDAKQYPASIFPNLYHSRWGIEELYKISKCFIEVEDYHGKSERRVKQELFAHFVLISLARIFECQAEDLLPEHLTGNFKKGAQAENGLKTTPHLPENRHATPLFENEKVSLKTSAKLADGQQLTSEMKSRRAKLSPPQSEPTSKETEESHGIKTQVKLNFKNSLLVLQRTLEHLFLLNSFDFVNGRVPRVLNSVVRLRQKIRPDRHYPRVSRKPLKRHRYKLKKEVKLGAAIAAPG